MTLRILAVLAIPTLAMCQEPTGLWGQTRAVAGFNLDDGRPSYEPMLGAGFDISTWRYFSIAADYAWSSLDTYHLGPRSERWSYHDVFGGVRARIPTGSRLTPILSGGGGTTIATGRASFGSYTTHDAEAHVAGYGGFGLEFRVSKRWSILADARAVRAEALGWHGYCGFGVAFRDWPGAGR